MWRSGVSVEEQYGEGEVQECEDWWLLSSSAFLVQIAFVASCGDDDICEPEYVLSVATVG